MDTANFTQSNPPHMPTVLESPNTLPTGDNDMDTLNLTQIEFSPAGPSSVDIQHGQPAWHAMPINAQKCVITEVDKLLGVVISRKETRKRLVNRKHH